MSMGRKGAKRFHKKDVEKVRKRVDFEWNAAAKRSAESSLGDTIMNNNVK